jgi:hypothetical protein
MGDDLRLKIAYYGAGLGGKTTNLQVLQAACEGARFWWEDATTPSGVPNRELLLRLSLPVRSGPRVDLLLHTEPG